MFMTVCDHDSYKLKAHNGPLIVLCFAVSFRYWERRISNTLFRFVIIFTSNGDIKGGSECGCEDTFWFFSCRETSRGLSNFFLFLAMNTTLISAKLVRIFVFLCSFQLLYDEFLFYRQSAGANNHPTTIDHRWLGCCDGFRCITKANG